MTSTPDLETDQQFNPKHTSSLGGPRAAAPEETTAVANGSAESSVQIAEKDSSRPDWREALSTLANPHFRFLWLSAIFMMSAWGMQMVAVGYLTYDLTSSPVILGIVQSGYGPSMLGLSLFGGALADRWNRKRIIMVGQLGAAGGACLIALVVATGQVTWVHLLMLSVFDGVWFSFLWPARQSIVPQVVGREKITSAIALDGAAMSATILIIPALAGGVYAFLGPEGVFFANAALGVTAAILVSFVPGVKTVRREAETSTVKEIKAGLSYILSNRIVLTLLIMGAATALFAMPFRQILPIFIVDVYERGPESMGIMLSAGGLGSLVGAVYIATLSMGRRGKLLLLGTFISAAGLMLMAAVPIYFAAIGFMAFMGLGDSGRRTLYQAILMEQVEDRFRGRVMSVWMLNFSLMPLGVLPAAAVAEFFGGQAAAGVLSVLVLITAMVVLLTQRRIWQIL